MSSKCLHHPRRERKRHCYTLDLVHVCDPHLLYTLLSRVLFTPMALSFGSVSASLDHNAFLSAWEIFMEEEALSFASTSQNTLDKGQAVIHRSHPMLIL